ncbi:MULTISPECIES: hypothetical protein [Burkholderia]|uniref:hypothetical protein n=1 Tax=Burkholderia TaxID=32008 RepID=UPI00104D6986|nr:MULTISPECIES: hypothetical protein [Burkholderia]
MNASIGIAGALLMCQRQRWVFCRACEKTAIGRNVSAQAKDQEYAPRLFWDRHRPQTVDVQNGMLSIVFATYIRRLTFRSSHTSGT